MFGWADCRSDVSERRLWLLGDMLEATAAGATYESWVDALNGLGADDTIVVHINSSGGSAFTALGLHRALAHHPATVEVHVEGEAASAAAVVAMAGDRVMVAPAARLFVHEVVGDDGGQADLLSDAIAATYAGRAGGTTDEWRDRMRAETWYSAFEAVEAGLADEVAGDDDWIDGLAAAVTEAWSPE